VSPDKGTRPWGPLAVPWEAARLMDDPTRLRLIYCVPPTGGPPDRADVRWGQHRLTVVLSQIGIRSQRLPLVYRCVELALSRDASGLAIYDGATGERADVKDSRYLKTMPDPSWTVDDLFATPHEYLTPRDFTE
jgi:hypothetical protein